ncbi:MAG: hypothetical protein MJ016_01420 [Victivallaceae bacterium]|nr:hypothetical protein [Victivallaceae bacterium]
METIAASLWTQLGHLPAGARMLPPSSSGPWRVPERGWCLFGEKTAFFLATDGIRRRFGAVALREKFLPGFFSGEKFSLPRGGVGLAGECNAVNAAALRRLLPGCAPSAPGAVGGVELISAPEAIGETGSFPVVLAERENFGDVLDAATFAAFESGMKRPFGVGVRVRDAQEAEKFFRAGATFAVLSVPGAPADGLDRDEYAPRVFLTGNRAVAVSEKDFAQARSVVGAALDAAPETAAAAAAHGAAWSLEISAPLSEAAHWILARELRKKAATPRELRFAPEGKETSVHAEIAACYGNYPIKTVLE